MVAHWKCPENPFGTYNKWWCVFTEVGRGGGAILIQLFIQGSEYCGFLFIHFNLNEHHSISFGKKWLK